LPVTFIKPLDFSKGFFFINYYLKFTQIPSILKDVFFSIF